jgi:ribonuclease BN (tRNA processing enzyme)
VAWAQEGLAALTPGSSAASAQGLVLVHEATFTSDRAAEAAAKRHSTVGGAVGVAQAVHARHALAPLSALVLTHFSQRYASHGSELERGDREGEDEAGRGASASSAEHQGLGFPVIHAADLLRMAL